MSGKKIGFFSLDNIFKVIVNNWERNNSELCLKNCVNINKRICEISTIN